MDATGGAARKEDPDDQTMSGKTRPQAKLDCVDDKLQFNGKENQQGSSEPKFCFECNRSLAKSKQLINLAGQEHRWHPECFKCNVCLHRLDRETSCHIYKDKILCREDYAKLRRDCSIKCSRCTWPIGASDWVRRAGRHVYHLACFSCDICLRQLSTGEQFAINSGQEKNVVRLLCRLHFAIEGTTLLTGEGSSSHSQTEAMSSQRSSNQLENLEDSLGPYDFSSSIDKRSHLQLNQMAGPKHQAMPGELCSKPLDLVASNSTGLVHLQNPSQLDDLSSQRGDIISGSSSNGSTTGMLVNGNLQSKSKRVRTTFTEDQLAILQTHFQHDSNPDGSDLERIATITGLSKRVTQVWFQNSRARQKKYMIKRKPGASTPVALNTPMQQMVNSTQFNSQDRSPGGSSSQHQEQIHRQQFQLAQPQQMDSSSARRKWSNVSLDLSLDARDDDFDDSRNSSEALMLLSEDSSD